MSLSSAQYEAVAHKEGPCMVLAGPGSGKTLTITKRIEYLISKYKVRPEEILVITFTKYAAKEMKQRFQYLMKSDSLPVTFGTFHGIYYGILKWAYGINSENLILEEEQYRLLHHAVRQANMEEMLSVQEEKDCMKDLLMEIGTIKNNWIEIADYESPNFGAHNFREIYQYYEAEKKKYKKIDFEDMLLLCLQLFKTRPDILEKWQKKFRYILIDEFQDVNQVQYEVIRMLAEPLNNLFVVGDDDQSIYGFRGAKPGIMLAFKKDYPKAKTVLLNKNFRSNGHIVNGSSRVIACNRQRFEKEIEAVQAAGETVHVQEVKNQIEESRYIIEQVSKYYNHGISYEQMAVLYRTNSDVRAIAESLSGSQIPFSMKDSLDNMYEHFIGKDIQSYFQLSEGIYNRSYFLQIANRPKRYIGRDSMSEEGVTFEMLRNFYCDKSWMMDRIDQLEWDIKMLKGKAPYPAIQYIRKSIGYDEFLKEYAQYKGVELEEYIGILDEMQERAKEFVTIEEWLTHVLGYSEMLRQKKKQKAEKQKGIALMTMHAAKGLEYDTVFIIQGNEGVIPYKKAKLLEEIEEERRLFYVAMTRAKRKLIISYVKEKNGKDLNPSRFVNELFGVI